MSKDYKTFTLCEKAALTCDKSQYKEASLWEKFKLNIHLIYCKACRNYSSNNGKLTKLIHNPEVDCLKDCEKDQLQDKFQKELEDYQ